MAEKSENYNRCVVSCDMELGVGYRNDQYNAETSG